jgi:hypothetical protein
MEISHNSKWKTRLVERRFPDRSFDIEFWQEQGDEAIFSAAWELVELAEEIKHGGKPRLKELLQVLNEFEVEYLIVGGFAVMKYGEPRYTKDLDVWANNSALNSRQLVKALKKFGAPLEHDGITAVTFTEKQVVYQIGIAPVPDSRANAMERNRFQLCSKPHVGSVGLEGHDCQRRLIVCRRRNELTVKRAPCMVSLRSPLHFVKNLICAKNLQRGLLPVCVEKVTEISR